MVNDYELIYLYKEEQTDEILQIIIDKYRPLIWKNIYKFYIKEKDQDDFYQEALITLVDCIDKFDEKHNKTFTKFFELILFRRFIILKDKSPKYLLYEKSELIEDSYTPSFDYLNEDIYLAPFEKQVFKAYFEDKMIIKEIAKMLEKDVKSIKNAIYRIKWKLRN